MNYGGATERNGQKSDEKIKKENEGTVEFKNVSFSYNSAEKPVLSNISFKAEKKKVTAIIGATGSGKTTLANLIARFYDVDAGQVLFDGVDVRRLEQKELHKRLGIVPQKNFLFSGSIKDNLLYGNEDATDERLALALDIAQCDFVKDLENGINSPVSQNATNFSGGQKQRLSIARALVRDAEVYIFDDSFSALDFKTDSTLRKALKGHTKDATTIIVAQRISTILNADKIIVLDEGRIAGIGTHSELMDKGGEYANMFNVQAQYYIDNNESEVAVNA